MLWRQSHTLSASRRTATGTNAHLTAEGKNGPLPEFEVTCGLKLNCKTHDGISIRKVHVQAKNKGLCDNGFAVT